MYRRSQKSELHPPPKPRPNFREGKVSHQIRLHGPEKTELRQRVYWRANGFCEMCGIYTPWKSGHLVHVQGVGAGGSDSEENTKWGCAGCHNKLHNAGGKPCPPK